MLLLEIAAQGLKGLSSAGGSARLRPGYNVLGGDSGALRRALEELFDGPGHAGEAGASGRSGGVVRVGATFVGNDGVTYRLVKDPSDGYQLLRFEAQQRAFSTVAHDASEVERRLSEVAGLAGPGRLDLLCISAGELPSRSESGLSVSSAASVFEPRPAEALAPEALATRTAELEAELAKARETEALQERLDAAQNRAFALEQVLKERVRLRDAVEGARADLEANAAISEAARTLGDCAEKLGAHARATAKRDEALERLASERGALGAPVDAGAPCPFWRAGRFWAGAGGGALALAAAAAGTGLAQGVRYLALLDIPAFGWAAWSALGWVSALEDHDRGRRRAELMAEHEAKIVATYERESAELQDVLRRLGFKAPAELEEALTRLREATAALTVASERLAAFEARAETRAADQQKAAVDGEIASLEEQLATLTGTFVRDVRAVEADLAGLERQAGAVAERAPAVATAPRERPSADPFRELAARAARALESTPGAVLLSLVAPASQLARAFSGARTSALSVDERGNLFAQVAGRPSPIVSLPAADRDLAYLALALALGEQLLGRWKAVLLLDDVFAGMPEAVRRRAGLALKTLARAGQVLHATADLACREAADHSA